MKRAGLIITSLLLSAPALAQTAAPVAPAQPVTPPNAEWLNMYEGPAEDTLTDLQKAHRSLREISDWASETVANALQFQPGKINEKINAVKPAFSEAGYKAYLAFLGAQPFADGLRGNTLKLSTIVNNAPLLIGQGASGGRYAWAFELPVIMTPAGQDTATPVVLRLQIGRNANGPAPHGIVIENWQVFQEDVQNPDETPKQP